MKKYFINYATSNSRYQVMQHNSMTSFKQFDEFDEYESLCEKCLDEQFKYENQKILDNGKGAGYWLWKPYIILNKLNNLDSGDILLYCDSGISQIKSLSPIFEHMQYHDVAMFLINDGLGDERDACKRDALILMNCDESKFWTKSKNVHSGQYGASYIFFRKSDATVQCVKEWLNFSQDYRIISDEPNTLGIDNYQQFNAHRHDQSILSLLCKKYDMPPIYDIS
jgi:hypothetical protein